jgi:hypothetical protein
MELVELLHQLATVGSRLSFLHPEDAAGLRIENILKKREKWSQLRSLTSLHKLV